MCQSTGHLTQGTGKFRNSRLSNPFPSHRDARATSPAHVQIRAQVRSRGEEVKNAFQDRNSDGQPVSSGQPEGALDPTEGTLEAGHVSEVKVAVELYM